VALVAAAVFRVRRFAAAAPDVTSPLIALLLHLLCRCASSSWRFGAGFFWGFAGAFVTAYALAVALFAGLVLASLQSLRRQARLWFWGFGSRLGSVAVLLFGAGTALSGALYYCSGSGSGAFAALLTLLSSCSFRFGFVTAAALLRLYLFNRFLLPPRFAGAFSIFSAGGGCVRRYLPARCGVWGPWWREQLCILIDRCLVIVKIAGAVVEESVVAYAEAFIVIRVWRHVDGACETGNTFSEFLMRKTDSKELAVSIDATSLRVGIWHFRIGRFGRFLLGVSMLQAS